MKNFKKYLNNTDTNWKEILYNNTLTFAQIDMIANIADIKTICDTQIISNRFINKNFTKLSPEEWIINKNHLSDKTLIRISSSCNEQYIPAILEYMDKNDNRDYSSDVFYTIGRRCMSTHTFHKIAYNKRCISLKTIKRLIPYIKYGRSECMRWVMLHRNISQFECIVMNITTILHKLKNKFVYLLF